MDSKDVVHKVVNHNQQDGISLDVVALLPGEFHAAKVIKRPFRPSNFRDKFVQVRENQ